jgi:D-3-phosphoglycerate dehydrogenase
LSWAQGSKGSGRSADEPVEKELRSIVGDETWKNLKVLISDPLSNKGLEILTRAEDHKYRDHYRTLSEELKKIIPEYDAIIIRSETKLKAEIVEATSRLKVIGRAGIGLDNVDLRARQRRGLS